MTKKMAVPTALSKIMSYWELKRRREVLPEDHNLSHRKQAYVFIMRLDRPFGNIPRSYNTSHI